MIITRLRLPSFVVTLAGQLGLSWACCWTIINIAAPGIGGTIRLYNSVLNDIENGAHQPAGRLDRDDRPPWRWAAPS